MCLIEYYGAIKNNELMHAIASVNLKNVMQNRVNTRDYILYDSIYI